MVEALLAEPSKTLDDVPSGTRRGFVKIINSKLYYRRGYWP